MALDLFAERWASWPPSPPPAATVISSPRISFSCDLDSAEEEGHHPRRSDNSLGVDGSPSSSEFDFCVPRDRPEQDSSAADDLFSDGVLLPLSLLYNGGSNPTAPTRPVTFPNRTTTTTTGTKTNTATTTVRSKSGGGGGGSSSSTVKCVFVPTTLKAPNKKEKQKEVVAAPVNSGAVDGNPPLGKQPLSFWRFRRSSSLNSGGSGEGGAAAGGRRNSLICSFPLLSRSKSAGYNPVQAAAKTRQQHQQSTTGTTAAFNASSSSKLSRKGSGNGGPAARNPYYFGHQHHGSTGGRISPVLNVPSPNIPRGSSSGLLSLGHLLCSVKDKRRKKTQFPVPP